MVTISCGFWYRAKTPTKADAAMTHNSGFIHRVSAGSPGVEGIAVWDEVMTIRGQARLAGRD